jgi:hypothetical protein
MLRYILDKHSLIGIISDQFQQMGKALGIRLKWMICLVKVLETLQIPRMSAVIDDIYHNAYAMLPSFPRAAVLPLKIQYQPSSPSHGHAP